MGVKDAVKKAFEVAWEATFGSLIDGFSEEVFEPLFSVVFKYLTYTPYPDNITTFGPPTNGSWSTFYNGLYQEILFFVPSLFGLVLGLAMFFNIFNFKQRKQTIRRVIFVYPFAYSWWWFGGWFLKFNDSLANFLISGAAENMSGDLKSMLLSIGGAVFAGAAVYTLGLLVLFVVLLMYKVRELAIYAYMVFMPVLLMLYGVPIDSVRGWAKSMIGKFVPLVFMTIPSALLIRMGSELVNTDKSGPEGAIMALAMIGGAALVPKYIFSFSSQVSNAVQKSSRAGRNIARGARKPPQQQSGGSRGGTPAGGQQVGSLRQTGGSGGGSSGSRGGTSQRDQFSHQGGVDFSPSMSRRRRQRRRAQKLGRGARKLAGKTKAGTKKGVKGAGNRVTESAAKNYYDPTENTAAGMGKDALAAARDSALKAGEQPIHGGKRAAKGTSKRMQKINRRIKARQEELKDEFGPTAGPRNLKEVDEAQSNLGPSESESDESSSTQSRSGLDASQTTPSNRQTYDRNQSDRTIGSVGSSSSSDTEEK